MSTFTPFNFSCFPRFFYSKLWFPSDFFAAYCRTKFFLSVCRRVDAWFGHTEHRYHYLLGSLDIGVRYLDIFYTYQTLGPETLGFCYISSETTTGPADRASQNNSFLLRPGHLIDFPILRLFKNAISPEVVIWLRARGKQLTWHSRRPHACFVFTRFRVWISNRRLRITIRLLSTWKQNFGIEFWNRPRQIHFYRFQFISCSMRRHWVSWKEIAKPMVKKHEIDEYVRWSGREWKNWLSWLISS